MLSAPEPSTILRVVKRTSDFSWGAWKDIVRMVVGRKMQAVKRDWGEGAGLSHVVWL